MLADQAELTREHLSELENGQKEVCIGALDKITRASDVTRAEFFTGL